MVNTLFKSKVSRKSCTANYEEKISKTVKLHSVSHGESNTHVQYKNVSLLGLEGGFYRMATYKNSFLSSVSSSFSNLLWLQSVSETDDLTGEIAHILLSHHFSFHFLCHEQESQLRLWLLPQTHFLVFNCEEYLFSFPELMYWFWSWCEGTKSHSWIISRYLL